MHAEYAVFCSPERMATPPPQAPERAAPAGFGAHLVLIVDSGDLVKVVLAPVCCAPVVSGRGKA